jgi:bifunctional UDP-N-acetylglucosamine pyrophosphorylase/glucosamine-1-phosphate N-acetyltransferase
MPVWWRDLERQAAEFEAGGAQGEVRIDASAEVAESAILDAGRGPITIGVRTRICAGAYIQGPVAIGSDCLIGNLAMIRGATSIGSGSRVGFAAEIKNAIIEEQVSIGPQCFVADSKIEAGAYLGAQVRTSNHRLDQRTVEVMVDGQRVDTGLEKLGCRIGARAALGIQVILLPGREVAADSIFAPRVTVEKNLPTGRYRLAQPLESF